MPERPGLKRSLSLPLITLYGLGTTIGAGIYVLVGKVAGQAGLFTPVSFLLAGGVAALTGLTFAELCARYPRSAGEALYVREGLGSPSLALLAGLLMVLAGTFASGTIALGAAGYAAAFLPLPKVLLVTLVVLALGGLAAIGIVESVVAASLFTLLEILGLLLIVWVGVGATPDLLGRLPETLPPFALGPWTGIFAGGLLAFFAFIGFEDMVNVAEEVRDVTRVLPLAIVLTLLVTGLVYIAVATVAVLVVDPAELAVSEAPLLLIYQRSGGQVPALVTMISIVATLNGALIQMIMGSRILYGLADQGALPAPLARVNRRTRTPLLATALVVGTTLVFALLFPIETLARGTSAMTLFVFSLVNLALVRLKQRGPAPAGILSMPPAVPVLGFLGSAGFLVLELLQLLFGP